MEGPLLSASVWVDLRPQARSHQHDVSWQLEDLKGNELGNIYHTFCLKYSTVDCLWLDLGIVENADLELEPERYSGGFGLALSLQSETGNEMVYHRVGFVQFSRWATKMVGRWKRSRISMV